MSFNDKFKGSKECGHSEFEKLTLKDLDHISRKRTNEQDSIEPTGRKRERPSIALEIELVGNELRCRDEYEQVDLNPLNQEEKEQPIHKQIGIVISKVNFKELICRGITVDCNMINAFKERQDCFAYCFRASFEKCRFTGSKTDFIEFVKCFTNIYIESWEMDTAIFSDEVLKDFYSSVTGHICMDGEILTNVTDALLKILLKRPYCPIDISEDTRTYLTLNGLCDFIKAYRDGLGAAPKIPHIVSLGQIDHSQQEIKEKFKTKLTGMEVIEIGSVILVKDSYICIYLGTKEGYPQNEKEQCQEPEKKESCSSFFSEESNKVENKTEMEEGLTSFAEQFLTKTHKGAYY